MSLQINYNAGIYEIQGMLNTENSVYLELQLQNIIEYSSGVVISLDKVEMIDEYTTKSVASLQERAQGNNKVFFIIGKKNKKVCDQFNALNLNHLLM
ncbi:STAS domain-containing protein [Flavobacterium muglaense]|uniref:STAS domain-containing protein n=1 Tax=Flavobacterium muglaense TaxID=2764716 RepID=A0A923MYM8_9FLAO|nr:STAS domain-containing protein [Flavobacterium muglaense]MBC5836940.1 hypothetical protein [Flavobacterium muglaense]MBC5843469.1 hypothetical protein [Flavobacterium muglaense]